ncbi:MAG: LptF/LptG family permease [Balneolaceae bacterium]
MNRLDRYIIFRLLTMTLMVVAVLIAIFILIDFSENSDEFADRGAPLSLIWSEYYVNYIPEMIRLITPVAIFVACLFLAGQMTERLEIVAIKASGISLYRLAVPFLTFGVMAALLISLLDAFLIPKSNSERIAFEREFLDDRTDQIDQGEMYRQESPGTILHIDHYDPNTHIGYRMTFLEMEDGEISAMTTAPRMEWTDSLEVWSLNLARKREFDDQGYTDTNLGNIELQMQIQPGDLSRHSSDIYQLTWHEAVEYIASIRRIGAGEISLPRVQFYGRVAYPASILIVTLIGFALASEQRKGGKGFNIAAGLAISFIYLAMMKVIEPFGAAGSIDPLHAALFPHLFFLVIGITLLILTKK